MRTAGNFTLKVVDTPRLLLGDRVNTEAFRDIAAGLGSRKVDVVLYVDRLYSYRIDPLDKQVRARHQVTATPRVSCQVPVPVVL